MITPKRTSMTVVALGALMFPSAYTALRPAVPAPVPTPAPYDILDNILNQSTNAATRAASARDRAREARDSADEIRDSVRDGIGAATSEIRDVIANAIADAQRIVLEELDGLEDFTADGGCSVAACQPFRQSIVTMLEDIETLLNTLSTISGGPPDLVNLQREIGVVQGLPGRALYPLYRVMMVDNSILSGGLLDNVSQTVGHLQVIGNLIIDPIQPPGAIYNLAFERQTTCDLVLNNPGLVRGARAFMNAEGLKWKLGATMLGALGKTKIEPQVGIHGYPGILIKADAAAKFSKIMAGISGMFFKLSSYVGGKVRYCMMVGAIDTVHTNQVTMLGDLEALELNQQALQETLDAILGRLSSTVRVLPSPPPPPGG